MRWQHITGKEPRQPESQAGALRCEMTIFRPWCEMSLARR